MRSSSAISDSTLRCSIAVMLQRSPQRMEQTLLSVLENLPPASEVLLVLDGRYEDPYRLEGEVRFVRAGHRATWAQCANAALSAAQGEWLQLLPAGSVVKPGWCQWIDHLPEETSPRVVIPAVYARSPAQTKAESGHAETEPGTEIPLPLEPWRPCRLSGALARWGVRGSGFFFHRSSVQEVGGWRLGLAAPWADVELADRLVQHGYLMALTPDCHVELSAAASPRSAWGRGWHQRRMALLVQSRWQKVLAAAAGLPRTLLRLAIAPGRAGQILAESLGGLGAWLTFPVLRPELPPLPGQHTLALTRPGGDARRREPPTESRRRAA